MGRPSLTCGKSNEVAMWGDNSNALLICEAILFLDCFQKAFRKLTRRVCLVNAATPSEFNLDLHKYLAGFHQMSCAVVVSVAVVEVGEAVVVAVVLTIESL